MAVTDPLVRVDRLRFGYVAERLLLDDVSFQIRPGDRVALVGPNGSGKTTLLQLLVGLLRPWSGTIECFGKPRREEADFREVRRRVGLVFQCPDDQLFCPTVAEDVAFGPLNLGKSKDEARQLAAETLGRVGLEHLSDSVTSRLSYGQKRLVALATVLAMQPDLLLLDEPANGLDEATAERLIGILSDLSAALVVVSHHDEVLAALTDRTLYLQRGVVVAA